MLKTLEEKIDPRWTALLVVDMQNDYIDPKGAAGRRGWDMGPIMAMVPRLQNLLEAARQAGVYVIYTRNWHSAATDGEAWLERAKVGTDSPDRAAVAGSWGADWYGVEPAEGEFVLNKFRYDAFLGTSLDFLLRARGIRTVVGCGTATNVCVESSIRAAHMRDYYVVLASDCCAAPDPTLHNATILNVERHFGVATTGTEIARLWGAARTGTATDREVVAAR